MTDSLAFRGPLVPRTDELVLHYQPRVRSLDHKVVAVEALVRWQHPVNGLMAPGSFLPQLSAHETIHELGRWVLWEAGRQAKAWVERGTPLRVSVNLTPRQLGLILHGGVVQEVLSRTGLPAQCLELEVVESPSTRKLEDFEKQALTELQSRGVRIVLDDFGTGHSSLRRLGAWAFDGIKLDASFVRELPRSLPQIQALIDVCRRLGIEVVVEGVETQDDLQALAAWPGLELQGYYFSRPVPANELEAYLGASTNQGKALPIV